MQGSWRRAVGNHLGFYLGFRIEGLGSTSSKVSLNPMLDLFENRRFCAASAMPVALFPNDVGLAFGELGLVEGAS